MAYNSVGTPRFFIDSLTWLNSIGVDIYPITAGTDSDYIIAGMNPTSQASYLVPAITGTPAQWKLGDGTSFPHTPLNFCAILGHNYANQQMEIGYHLQDSQLRFNITEIINAEGVVDDSTGRFTPEYNGYSIMTFKTVIDSNIKKIYIYQPSDSPTTNDWEAKTGALIFGSTYTMPHSPDLKLSISYETGTKEQTTRGGATLTNNMWGVVKWGDLAAWELSDPNGNTLNQDLSNQSRRIWDLSFSYLDKENTFPKYSALNTIGTNDYPQSGGDNDTSLENTLATSDDFYSQVWNKVGNQHRFIFQPDNTVNEFAICKIDGNIKFTQVANGVYNIKLKIREVW
tara:strand:- start:1562 stop:2587 length:1026 start_codon:yes stop_codon:yes gene_type:complete